MGLLLYEKVWCGLLISILGQTRLQSMTPDYLALDYLHSISARCVIYLAAPLPFTPLLQPPTSNQLPLPAS